MIIARTEEEFSQVVKQYHLQDLTANEEDKLYLATNQGFEIIKIREILYIKSIANCKMKLATLSQAKNI